MCAPGLLLMVILLPLSHQDCEYYQVKPTTHSWPGSFLPPLSKGPHAARSMPWAVNPPGGCYVATLPAKQNCIS
jgi:hypothetical protein